MWKAWAHPLWLGGEVWFRHYMLSQPRIKCANSRCCILGCVRCLFFFPLVLVAFFVAVLQEQSCCFFLLPSACLALGQLLGVSAGDFRGLQERRVWWWKEKKKKRGRGPAVALQAPRCLSSTPAALEHSEEKKGFPTRCWIPFVWFMVEESLWKVGFVCHLCIWILAFCAVLEQSQYYMTYI